MSNYIVACEGNPQVLSSWCHLGNLIPHYFKRPKMNLEAKKKFFPLDGPKRGAQKNVYLGTTKMGAFLRPDCKAGAFKIFQVT